MIRYFHVLTKGDYAEFLTTTVPTLDEAYRVTVVIKGEVYIFGRECRWQLP